MEIEKLVHALEETILRLQKSSSSIGSSMPVEEIVKRFEAEVGKARNLRPVDVNLLERLFAPTGVIQEISIDNGWGTKFLHVAKVIDQFISS